MGATTTRSKRSTKRRTPPPRHSRLCRRVARGLDRAWDARSLSRTRTQHRATDRELLVTLDVPVARVSRANALVVEGRRARDALPGTPHHPLGDLLAASIRRLVGNVGEWPVMRQPGFE